MTLLLLALAAGALTLLSPCVLPVVPVVLMSAVQRHRLAPLALIAGMAGMFAFAGTVLAAAGFATGASGNVIRDASAVLMLAFGAVLVSGTLQQRVASALAPLGRMAGAASRFTPDGLAGHAMLGMLLGAVWTPCSGPTLGAAMGLAAASEDLPRAAAVMLAFGIGAGLPMLALAYGSRQALTLRRDRLARLASWSKPLLGLVLLALGAAIILDLDRLAEAWVVAWMPEWLIVFATRY